MNILAKIFTWWDGATIGTALFSSRNGRRVGEDVFGNTYFQSKKAGTGHPAGQRWVIYNGPNDASRVPPEWHGWLHHTVDTLPTEEDYAPREWQQPHMPNLTGTRHAYRPAGSLHKGGERPQATGDYKAWRPE